MSIFSNEAERYEIHDNSYCGRIAFSVTLFDREGHTTDYFPVTYFLPELSPEIRYISPTLLGVMLDELKERRLILEGVKWQEDDLK